MKRILLTISYDGTDYHGWQVQPNGITVQEALQNALFKMMGEKPNVTGCSRTDAGVHAKEFCCHIDCDEKYPDNAFLKGLNSLLPKDIAVVRVRDVEHDFHARYSAKGKTYVYYIKNDSEKNPFASRYSWQIERKLDLDTMNELCSQMIGTHDFVAFSSSGRTVEDTVRTVKECEVTEKNGLISLKITADGFLYNMVRIITGTAVEASFGRCLMPDKSGIFENGRRELAGQTAPPQGLFLEKVIY